MSLRAHGGRSWSSDLLTGFLFTVASEEFCPIRLTFDSPRLSESPIESYESFRLLTEPLQFHHLISMAVLFQSRVVFEFIAIVW